MDHHKIRSDDVSIALSTSLAIMRNEEDNSWRESIIRDKFSLTIEKIENNDRLRDTTQWRGK